jgi:hypothetical protein
MSIIGNDNDNYYQQYNLYELANNALVDTKSDAPNSKTGINHFANITKADDNPEKRKEKRK